MKGYVFKRNYDTSFDKDSTDATSVSKSITLLPKIDHAKHIPNFEHESVSRGSKRDILPVFTKTRRLFKLDGKDVFNLLKILSGLYRSLCFSKPIELKRSYISNSACEVVAV